MTLPRVLANPSARETHSRVRNSKRGAIGPACLSCAQPMQHTRTIPRLRLLAELRCYECRSCRLGVTEECAA